MQDLPGKTALVAGSASGVGPGIGRVLMGAGMNVVIANIRDNHLSAASDNPVDAGYRQRLEFEKTPPASYGQRRRGPKPP